MKSQIIYEDNEILVIYKPEGLAAQSARVTQPDVVSEICSYLKSPYVGLVHRLDQPVEGLMVLGKTKEATAKLSRQVTDGMLEKTYLAVVTRDDGKAEDISAEWTKLTDCLTKDGKSGKAMIAEDNGQQAVLFYRRLSSGEHNTALLEIRLVTGRFHQIRLQMSHHSMPLLGDVKYGSENSAGCTKALSKEIRSVCLCAYKLAFLHPKTKKPMKFEIKPHKPVFDRYVF